jgi:hypothetical protein
MRGRGAAQRGTVAQRLPARSGPGPWTARRGALAPVRAGTNFTVMAVAERVAELIA